MDLADGKATPRRVVLIANRLPATVRLEDGVGEFRRSIGGVATGLDGVHQHGGGVWIGWPGETPALDPAARVAMDARFAEERYAPIELSREEVRRFYEGFSNGVLWPLFHYQTDRVPLDSGDFDAYRAVNERYADLAAKHVRPGDVVWIHDYQLCLVPELLRKRAPDARIGFFLHIPFPSAEVFRVLPWRDAILRGLLGADLVGFHTFAYLRHFATSLRRGLDLEVDVDRVVHDGREVRLGVFPMGVDARRFAELGDDPAVQAAAAQIRREAPEKILLGIDRLDYTKGIRRRLIAFGRLLERAPELRGKVRFVQVAVPSRERVGEYVAFRREVDELVGRINGRHGTLGEAPIHYMHRSFDPAELAALYRAADVAVVTPLRDGMNLVAKEFVATRTDDDGVLVLSEFAGAASELGEAVVVNPFDVDATADALLRAIEMPREERAVRMRALRGRVRSRDVHSWADDFLSALDKADGGGKRERAASVRDAEAMAERLGRASKLVAFLDYDGTLVPFAATPDLASPDPELLALLKTFASAPGTDLHLVSGRRREDLERWFGALSVDLHAEHGLWSKPAGGEWFAQALGDVGWKSRVRPFLEQATSSVPGSSLEEKTAGWVWHWRAADPELGARQARELRAHLSDLLANAPVEVLIGEKIVELRLQAAHKGTVVARVMAAAPPGADSVAIGDDRTDEDLFRALKDGVAIRVGRGVSEAEHRLDDWRKVRAFLEGVARLRRGGREATASSTP